VCIAIPEICPYDQCHGTWKVKEPSEREKTTRLVCNLLSSLVLSDDIKSWECDRTSARSLDTRAGPLIPVKHQNTQPLKGHEKSCFDSHDDGA
jgi:hypothetical protein